MSKGLTLAEFVQQVYYAIYKVRLDTSFQANSSENFQATTSKFQEVIMEANFVLQELQKEADWTWLRGKWDIGTACNPCHGIAEYEIPEEVYRLATGWQDGVRLYHCHKPLMIRIPFVSASSGNSFPIEMHNHVGEANVRNTDLTAFAVGEVLTFNRPFTKRECGLLLETDVIHRMEPLHICDDSCEQPCRQSYQKKWFTEIPDPYYMVVRTAAKRAEGDPAATERVMSLSDDASKTLSAMRRNHAAKTTTDTYQTSSIGFIGVY